MNNVRLSFRKMISTICSAMIPYKPLRHKVRYMLNPLNDKRVERYFREQYVLPLKDDFHKLPTTRQANENIEYIWQCWLQGIEQAPNLVKMCLQSVEKYKKSNQKIVIITNDNYSDFIKLPPTIIAKWKQGIIHPAHFADILRVNLLTKYGGYWIDATCLLTAPIAEWIDSTSFFMYNSFGEFDYTLIQNCFIHAKANDYLIRTWCIMINHFWEKEAKHLHYFQHHLMFKAVISMDSKAKEKYQKMPVVSEKDMQVLMDFILLGAPYSTKTFEEIKKISFIHKLTYKKEIPDEFYSFYSSNQQTV